MSVVKTNTVASILSDPDMSSVKRIAWAYGCSKRDSYEERMLYEALVERIRKVHP
jgi:hypothetical protein